MVRALGQEGGLTEIWHVERRPSWGRVMKLETINYIALFAGAFLLMSRSGYRPHLWSRFEHRARSRSEKKSRSRAENSGETETVLVSEASEGKAARAADGSLKPSAGIYAATLMPYGCGGHYFFGGHYG
jgi:hypothetical protein